MGYGMGFKEMSVKGRTEDVILVNDKYQVDVRFSDKKRGIKSMVWLSIKRKDKNWIRDWREFQKIKNAICGNEREACEIYPAESRLVDTSNQYHLWVLDEKDWFPFGYMERMIVSGHKGGWGKGSGQRDFKHGQEPDDIMNIEEARDRKETKILFGKKGDKKVFSKR